MSVRALAALAAFLCLLCVASAALLAHRLGWWGNAQAPEWTFVNPTLTVARGQRVIVRPILEGMPSLRYTFLVAVTDPTDDPMAPVPHLLAGVEEQDRDEWEYRPPEAALSLCQMGAMTPQEWLEEIQPVEEVGGAGGGRMLLRALYGHRSGASVAYYHDPSNPVPAVGWIRKEMLANGQLPEVNFASDGGRVQVPPLPDKPR